MSTKEDLGSEEFFAEVDKENEREYIKCSVVDAFDDVFSCYRIKEQARNYYRYGTKKNCEHKWDYFKLCFSTKLKSSENADALLRAHQETVQERKAEGPNSEDVWEARI
ncbi:hypothetical protein BY458DRAFT_528531 [Sporodiniella umbellata]|nr:hypothetical protein BY458DRAFT_528531 [Sporodiniella umbellata]